MIDKIVKGIKDPKKAFEFIKARLESIFKKKQGVMIYLGLNKGASFDWSFRNFESCYGFEANPDLFDRLVEKYKNYPHVHLFNLAVGTENGEVQFNISSNDGEASSIGNFNKEWNNVKNGDIKMLKTITVPCVNLLDFCKEHNIDFIDEYISDIQGMDLEVLRTMKPMLDTKKIGTISCEVGRDDKLRIYADLPPNNESEFKKLLDSNYSMIAKGWGVLKDNHFEEVPDDWCEMDCKWILRDIV